MTLAHPGWVQELGQEVAELTSHHLSLFGLQGFTCRNHMNREYILPSHQATQSTRVPFSSLGLGLSLSTARCSCPMVGLLDVAVTHSFLVY